MSVKLKVLNYLKVVERADEWSIKTSVNSWQDRHYKESTIERQLRNMTEEGILLSKRYAKKMWYKLNA